MPPKQRPAFLRDAFPDLDAGRNKSNTELVEKDTNAKATNSSRPSDEGNRTTNSSPTLSLHETNNGEDTSKEREKETPETPTDKGKGKDKPKKTRYPRHPLLAAIHATFFWRWWIAGFMKLCAGTLQRPENDLTLRAD